MKNDYLVEKKPIYALIIFALPIIIGNIFQQTYTIADSAIVGRFVGEQALAAVGASYALTNIFICIAVGGGMGASIVVSQYFGARDYIRMKKTLFTSLISFLILGSLLGIFGFLFSENIMRILNTPKDCLDMAVVYLEVYFFGLPFLFMYNVISSMFNALGKSKIPLYFLIFSSVFNIILDIVLVKKYMMGVLGVAVATLIAQGISAVLSFLVLLYILNGIGEKNRKFFDLKELSNITKIALPSIFQQSTVSIGMMLVQSVVNSFGSEALAGFSAAMRIEALFIVPMLSIGNAVSSFTAQNIGAGKKDRVVEGYKNANMMVVFFSVITFFVLEIFSRDMISFFLGKNISGNALFTGVQYLKFMGWFFCLVGFKMAVDGVLRGAGDMRMFTVANIVNLFIRVSISFAFAPVYGIQMVWYAVPIGWFSNWIISFMQYRTQNWRYISLTEGV